MIRGYTWSPTWESWVYVALGLGAEGRGTQGWEVQAAQAGEGRCWSLPLKLRWEEVNCSCRWSMCPFCLWEPGPRSEPELCGLEEQGRADARAFASPSSL